MYGCLSRTHCPVESCFFQQVVICYCPYYFDAQIVQQRDPSSWILCPFDMSPSVWCSFFSFSFSFLFFFFFEEFLSIWHRMFPSHLVPPVSSLELAISPRNPSFFQWEVVLGVLIAFKVLLFLGPFYSVWPHHSPTTITSHLEVLQMIPNLPLLLPSSIEHVYHAVFSNFQQLLTIF